MGREAMARVTFQGTSSRGKVLLETEELLYRGEPRLRIAFKDVTRAEAEDGDLFVAWSGGEAVFELGDDAPLWAERIRTPKPLLDRMNVKQGAKVVVLGVRDEDFLADLAERTADVSERIGKGADLVVFLAETTKRLEKLPDLAKAIKPDGAVWVVHPKGRQDIKDQQVIAAGRAAGLVDNKVVKFSASHSALRFVVPLAKR